MSKLLEHIEMELARDNLERPDYEIRWIDYPMGHEVCLEEVTEISAFFQEVL
ncbi:MAG: hypothetical protein WD356_05540 [Pseudomonadales bacterium]